MNYERRRSSLETGLSESLREAMWHLMVIFMLGAAILFSIVWLKQNLEPPHAVVTCGESGGKPCQP